MTDFLNSSSAVALAGAALLFVVYFSFERYWLRSTMGQSLMVMGLGLLILSGQAVAFQVLGEDYTGRTVFVIVGRLLVTVALVQRIYALAAARRADS